MLSVPSQPRPRTSVRSNITPLPASVPAPVMRTVDAASVFVRAAVTIAAALLPPSGAPCAFAVTDVAGAVGVAVTDVAGAVGVAVTDVAGGGGVGGAGEGGGAGE